MRLRESVCELLKYDDCDPVVEWAFGLKVIFERLATQELHCNERHAPSRILIGIQDFDDAWVTANCAAYHSFFQK